MTQIIYTPVGELIDNSLYSIPSGYASISIYNLGSTTATLTSTIQIINPDDSISTEIRTWNLYPEENNSWTAIEGNTLSGIDIDATGTQVQIIGIKPRQVLSTLAPTITNIVSDDNSGLIFGLGENKSITLDVINGSQLMNLSIIGWEAQGGLVNGISYVEFDATITKVYLDITAPTNIGASPQQPFSIEISNDSGVSSSYPLDKGINGIKVANKPTTNWINYSSLTTITGQYISKTLETATTSNWILANTNFIQSAGIIRDNIDTSSTWENYLKILSENSESLISYLDVGNYYEFIVNPIEDFIVGFSKKLFPAPITDIQSNLVCGVRFNQGLFEFILGGDGNKTYQLGTNNNLSFASGLLKIQIMISNNPTINIYEGNTSNLDDTTTLLETINLPENLLILPGLADELVPVFATTGYTSKLLALKLS